jgi:hypothetical protein
MLMRHIPLIVFTFLLCIAAPIAAQDATPEIGWPIEQHCVGDPIPPPADWTYDGTIFAYEKYKGVRGLRSDLATSYHVTYEGDSVFNTAGSFSPDRKWFAVPVGETYLPITLSPATSHYAVNHIVVYSTDLARKVYTVHWQAGYEGYDTSIITPIRWLDNEHLIYTRQDGYVFGEPQFQTFIINPFTQEITTWVKPFNPLNHLYMSIAPDYSKVLYFNNDKATQNAGWGIYDFDSGELLILLEDFERGIWFNNSSQFIGVIYRELPEEENAYTRTLALFDLNGNPQEVIYQYSKKSSRSVVLSANTQYIAFDDAGNLFLADVLNKEIYDLCLQYSAYPNYPKWSPDSTQLALTNNSKLTVFDTESWQLYELPYEIGDVIAWGAAD